MTTSVLAPGACGLSIIDNHEDEGPMRTLWVHPLSSRFVLMEFVHAHE